MRKRNAVRTIIFAASAVALALTYGARAIRLNFTKSEALEDIQSVSRLISVSLLLLLTFQFLLSNRIYKGPRYFWYHWRVKNRLEKQMLDAGFGIQRNWYVSLPKIKLSFSKDFSSGILKVQNMLRYDKKLDDTVLSAALGKFVVECHHQTDDANHYVYELIDGSVSFKLTFKTYKEFLRYNATLSPYELSLDKRSQVCLQHTLVVGMTGAGKSIETYNIIMQMINKSIPYELYISDLKGSGLAVLGEILGKKTAVEFDDTVELIKAFVTKMRERKIEMKELLKTRLDADYSDFGLSPHVLIIDEYASFAEILNSKEKKVRDPIMSMLYETVLQGRQLGNFLFLTMQKSDAKLIDTALRDNIPLKIVLGNSEPQTYITAFGHTQIPNRDYGPGDGVFTEPRIAPEPKLVQCPYCDFDILRACEQSLGGVTTQAPKRKNK